MITLLLIVTAMLFLTCVCLFSPDACYFIHRRHFIWPKKVNKSEEIEWLQELPYENVRIFRIDYSYSETRTYVRYSHILALLNKRRRELRTEKG